MYGVAERAPSSTLGCSSSPAYIGRSAIASGVGAGNTETGLVASNRARRLNSIALKIGYSPSQVV